LTTRPVTLTVTPELAGERLDRLLARELEGVGRKRAREWCEAGRVTLDGKRAKPATPVVAGAVIVVDAGDEGALPDPSLALDVRFESDEVVVLYKPAGVPSAPLREGELGTLANAFVARYPESAGVGHRAREPGLIHRLDTDTSGLLVAVRSERAFAALASALSRGQLDKRYLAVAERLDLPDEGSVDLDLAPDPRKKGRVRVASAEDAGYSHAATTRYRVLERAANASLVEVVATPAFRHQVRAHLAAIGAPLIGDTLYGGAPWPGEHPRHALHASYVAWAGDGTLPSFEVEADLPDELRALLEP
jgi:23S rRNA pseudouridine1911/1915/1917 synthase